MRKNSPSRFRPWQINLIFVLVVLLGAACLWLAFGPGEPGVYASVDFGMGIREEIPLDTDHDYYYEVEERIVHLQVRDGAIAFLDSQCPDHICENFGWLSQEGQWASCIPLQVYLSIESRE